MFELKVVSWIFCFNIALVATNEFRSIITEGEFVQDESYVMGIIPGITPSSEKTQRMDKMKALLQEENYIHFVNYVKNGVTVKGKTFNIYDEDMRYAALTLSELIANVNNAGFDAKKMFDFDNINEDIVSYAFDLNMLYGAKHPGKQAAFVPPFIRKPNHFVNAETIFKALKLSNHLNYYVNNTEEARVNQYYKIDDTIVINTNYSGWNLLYNGGDEEINYFREDISLNSYYYGLHLMHPYWLSSQELDELHPRHNEHYYYTHQQLQARLYLEKEHLNQGTDSSKEQECGYVNYNPYLVHDNGLAFPTRYNLFEEWTEERARIKSIDIAIRECMDRGLIIIDNGTTINMTEDNYVDLLAKLIRANYDGIKSSKLIRSLFGYGNNGFSYDAYNPSPSLLHHPETTLRDPIYWYMIQYVLNYFTDYKENMIPSYNITDYETTNYTIVAASIPKITTYFDYYQFNINRAVTENAPKPLTLSARQKRLKHSQFTLSFTVESKVTENGIVRLFLGPPCYNCWQEYSKFFELDTFEYYLQKGTNIITWSPETSKRLSNDEYYNLEGSSAPKRNNKYNIFKFPENLLIPRGVEGGLNLTLFIMITPSDDIFDGAFIPPINLYDEVYKVFDRKPLGFPFHRPVADCRTASTNFKFYDILVHHKQNNVPSNGYFSSNLY